MATPSIADSAGRVLAERYRLQRYLDSGASAAVFVAEDLELGRTVALKMLHEGLASDPAFLSRFRAEARAVALLNHPNVVQVYDWGQDRGSPFIVTELLRGGSLRSLLDSGRRLTVAQAASVGRQAAAGLAHAHGAGLVHRDIKPANLLFHADGRLAVADFGLARAVAEASITEQIGTRFGTARYASPEQVRGASLDERSDVYSLALVLVEAITGAVPFAADTIDGTALARTVASMPVPADAGALAGVLERAGALDPAERMDARAFEAALAELVALVPPAPLPLAPLGVTAPYRPGVLDLTEYPGKARLYDAEAAGDVSVPAPRQDPEPEVVPAPAEAVAGDGPPPTRRRRRWPRLLAALVVLVAAGGGGAAAWRLTRPAPLVGVPGVEGEQVGVAGGILASDHLRLVVTGRVYSATEPRGAIVSQSPDPPARSRRGAVVDAVVSLGPAPVPVPQLSGDTTQAAEQVLDLLKLRFSITQEPSMTYAAGTVIANAPDAGTLLPGQTVTLTVSTGKPQVTVPALGPAQSASLAAATAALSALQLQVVPSPQYSDTVPNGQVIATVPPGGTVVTVGSTVTVQVSKGPHVVPVPDVSHDSVGAATEALSSAGFGVSGVTGNPLGTVVATVPSAGTVAHYGSAVQLVTG